MRVRPISGEALAEELADRIAGWPGGARVRVAVDGADVARPGELADRLVAPLRVRGRRLLRVSAGDLLRPALLRLECGRTDPDVFYDERLDTKALLGEVPEPPEPGGSGGVLRALWDSATDRSFPLPYRALPPGGALLLDGPLLLGRGLP